MKLPEMTPDMAPEVFQAATGVHIRRYLDASNSHIIFSLIFPLIT